MGGSSETTTNTVRYAEYIESHHHDMLNTYYDVVRSLLWDPAEQATRPYSGYTDLDIEDAFFGAGYALDSFPSLYDMYGKFMAGLDVEVLFDQVFEDTINGTVIDNLVSAEADVLSDDLENEAIPRFDAGMRDINSVMSSSFVVGRAMMETARTKAISRFSAEIRGKLLPIVTDRWRTHLDWNKMVIESYSQILKFYLISKIDVTNQNFEVHAKDKLWPFSIMEYERLAVGTLHGAYNSTTDVAGASKGQKMLGGAMMGAASGAMIGAEIGAIGGPLGALIGAGVGLAAGLL